MEFSEKLTRLRKDRGLTQEQLAQKLFVSRTAISKWENGRGTPSIDSLQSIARFFDISVDELLSAEEILENAINEQRSHTKEVFKSASAWLSISFSFCFFLPLYRQEQGDGFVSVPLYQTESAILFVFVMIQVLMALCGIGTLLMLKHGNQHLEKSLLTAGDALCMLLAIAFVLALQPYPACISILVLIAKFILRIKSSQLNAL